MSDEQRSHENVQETGKDNAREAAQDGKTLLGGAGAEAGGNDIPDGQQAAPPKDDEPPAGAPEKYDLQYDQGLFDATAMAGACERFKKANLSNEQAQVVVKMAEEERQAAIAAHETQIEDWGNKVRTDKEMGGAHFDTTLMYANTALKRFDAGGQVFSVLDSTGYGNHPEVVRFLSRIGRALGEDGLVTGKGKGGDEPLHERMFKNSLGAINPKT